MNDKSFLLLDSFKALRVNEYIEADSLSLPILERGKRKLKNVLNRVRGEVTKHLTLDDIVVVKGFHINIISKARLRSSGV